MGGPQGMRHVSCSANGRCVVVSIVVLGLGVELGVG